MMQCSAHGVEDERFKFEEDVALQLLLLLVGRQIIFSILAVIGAARGLCGVGVA